MSTPDQTLPLTGSALDAIVTAVRKQLVRVPLGVVGPVLEVVFPAANTPRDLAHGLGVVPDGYLVVLQSRGMIYAVDVDRWTTEVAWLQASVAQTRARVLFYRLQEGVITHVVP